MAQAMGVTKQQVAQIWASAGLKPHRLKTFKISRGFAEKVVDVVGLYMNPPDNALVLSVDRRSKHLTNAANVAVASRTKRSTSTLRRHREGD